MGDFNTAELLKGSVEKVSTQLANLTDAQLKALHDAEHKGAGRVTMLGAIDREVDARIERAAAEGAPASDIDVSGGEATTAQGGMVADVTGTVADPANDDEKEPDTGEAIDRRGALQKLEDALNGMGIHPHGGPGAPRDGDTVDRAIFALQHVTAERDEADEELRKAREMLAAANGADPSGGALYSQVQLDQALDTLRADMERAADARVEEAVKAATAKPRPKTRAAKPMAVADDADLSAGRDHASLVQLVDTDDVAIAELPALAFDRSAYRFEGERALVLQRPINVPPTTPRREVAAAFLSVGGKVLGKATLATPFAVGGGLATQLPPGSLSFERVAPTTPSAPLAG